MTFWDELFNRGFPPHQVYQAQMLCQLSGKGEDEILRWFLLFETSHRDRGNLCLSLTPKDLKDALDQWDWPVESSQKQLNQLKETLLSQGPISFNQALTLYQGENPPYILHHQRLYSRRHFNRETSLKELLAQRLEQTPQGLPQLDLSGVEKLMEAWKKTAPFPPGEELLQAFKRLCSQGLSIISGGPGTGKTTLLLSLVGLLQLAAEVSGQTMARITLAAPTGRAAKRMSETLAILGDQALEAQTLHRLLGLNSSRPKTLNCDLLVVDEASMMDNQMMIELLKALPLQASLLLMGDKDQLPSVESGALLGDMLQDLQTPGHRLMDRVTLLHRIYRSSDVINQLARRIGQGDLSLLNSRDGFPDDGSLELVNLPEKPQHLVEQLALQFQLPSDRNFDFLPADSMDHEDQLRSWFQLYEARVVLCPLRKGPWGVEALNAGLSSALMGSNDGIFHGQPLMFLRNDYQLGLFNGDRGIILKFRGQPFGVFKEAKGYRAIPLSYLTQWECCFAQTVHKSQGSEYKRVLFVLPPGAQNMMYRELLYTGVTRASDELKIYAFEESLKSCLSRPVRRFSGLSEFFLTSDY